MGPQKSCGRAPFFPLVTLARLLYSRDLAIILLFLMTALIIYHLQHWGTVISNRLASTPLEVVASYTLLSAGVLFVINVTACSIQRAWQEGRSLLQGGRELRVQIEGLSYRYLINGVNPARLGEVEGVLHRRGYRGYWDEKARQGAFRRGSSGRWGSILYHACYMLVILGLYLVQQSHFVGIIVVQEGVEVEPAEALVEKDREPPAPLPVAYRLEDFRITYEQDHITDAASTLSLTLPGGARHTRTVRINQPWTVGGYTYLLERYGYAPRLVVKEEAGKTLLDSYVNLVLIPAGEEDGFQIPGTPHGFRVRLYPDGYLEGGIPRTRANEPRNPLLWISHWKGEKKLAEGAVRPGGTVELGQVSVSFPGWGYWNTYRVVSERGGGLLQVALWLGLLGLLWRFLVTEKQIFLRAREGGLEITGTSELYKSLFGREFELIRAELERVVAARD